MTVRGAPSPLFHPPQLTVTSTVTDSDCPASNRSREGWTEHRPRGAFVRTFSRTAAPVIPPVRRYGDAGFETRSEARRRRVRPPSRWASSPQSSTSAGSAGRKRSASGWKVSSGGGGAGRPKAGDMLEVLVIYGCGVCTRQSG